MKRKQKPARQYMTVSSKETKSNEEIKQAPKKKGVFARVVREKKEDQKKEPVKEPPKRIPKITVVHKMKPKGDEKSKPEGKRRTDKKKRTFIELEKILPKELYDRLKIPKDKEPEKKDEQDVDTNPLVSTPLANEANFDVEDTQNPLESHVQDVVAKVVKDKGSEDKVSEEAPK
ncbi:uncharacterized protein LOC131856832 [Cryptomeria japonica]|uniref:uncharacterized protein LOC131856832 n=1 Tax=Cryptomeria japonica TaxID=3369 RepID=UPI0027DA59F1|nr:uncharacterized protein LOC131856832 [Cryptomeria japonica]